MQSLCESVGLISKRLGTGLGATFLFLQPLNLPRTAVPLMTAG